MSEREPTLKLQDTQNSDREREIREALAEVERRIILVYEVEAPLERIISLDRLWEHQGELQDDLEALIADNEERERQ